MGSWMPKVTWRSSCGYFVSTVCLGCTTGIGKVLVVIFVAYLWALLGVPGMGFRDELANLSSKPSFLQFSSVQSLSPTLCDPVNHGMPGLPVHRQLLEVTQTHVHWVGDAIQPSQSLSSPSSCPQSFPASGSFQMSQLFASVGPSNEVSASTSGLPVHIQD